ncbi:MAG: putative toxin, partial [Vulcanimicrobiaceae bacterium]
MSQIAYDDAGRLVQTSIATEDPGSNCATATYAETRTYDAQNQLVARACSSNDQSLFGHFGSLGVACDYAAAGGTTNAYGSQIAYGYGPNGHPITEGTFTFHWDGDSLLFVSDSAGRLFDFKIEGLANTQNGSTSGPLTVADRDMHGQLATCHQPTTYCDWSADVDGTGLDGGFGFSRHDVRTATFNQPRLDGFDDGTADRNGSGAISFQGVRTYDPGIAQWTTPDAYQGTVDDPMSQKPYVWNRNNPIAYSDPSGYVPGFDVVEYDNVQPTATAYDAFAPFGTFAVVNPSLGQQLLSGAAFGSVAGAALLGDAGLPWQQFEQRVRDAEGGVKTVFGRLIPDSYNEERGRMAEAKFVNYQALTKQLRAYMELAKSRGESFTLYIRQGAKVSAPLRA